jgi:hypothetical protein
MGSISSYTPCTTVPLMTAVKPTLWPSAKLVTQQRAPDRYTHIHKETWSTLQTHWKLPWGNFRDEGSVMPRAGCNGCFFLVGHPLMSYCTNWYSLRVNWIILGVSQLCRLQQVSHCLIQIWTWLDLSYINQTETFWGLLPLLIRWLTLALFANHTAFTVVLLQYISMRICVVLQW